MTTSKRQKEEIIIIFRVVGLLADQVDKFREHLDGLPVESHLRKGKNDYVVIIELTDSVICNTVRQALSSCPLTAPYGIYVSLVTEKDSDGLTLPPFVCDFWRQIGGSLDFSFTVV
jgi:hypothetical protein